MSGRTLLTALAGTLLALLLSACASMGIQEGDSGSDLGAMRQRRPGDIYAQLGQEYLKEGQPGVALNKLKRGLDIDPGNARIHAVLGLLYERLGEARPAAEHYASSVELEPQNPFFHNAWGSFLCQQGEYEKADEQFRQALDNPLYNQPWATQTNAGVCALRAEHSAAAEQYLRQALTSNPRIPLALLKMAQINIDRGEYAGAHDYLVRYGQLVGPSPPSLLLQLKAALGLGDKAAAAQLLGELTKRFPDAPETQIARGLSPS
jgi:type IV pilus assembly protein PilF